MDGQKGGLLLVLAHPDDESMGTGGLILRHTRNGIPTHLVCATYGEAGWTGKPAGARREELAEIRARELEEAAVALGLSGVELWDYPDGGVKGADQGEISSQIAAQVTRLRPRAVVGWGPDGGYGHPDHIAVGACTDAALASIPENERPALYHLGVDPLLRDFYREAIRLGGGRDSALELELSERVDVVIELDADEVMMKVRAIDCHRSQLEDWRVAIRDHPHLLKKGYGHEPYLAVPSPAAALTAKGLLAEFA